MPHVNTPKRNKLTRLFSLAVYLFISVTRRLSLAMKTISQSLRSQSRDIAQYPELANQSNCAVLSYTKSLYLLKLMHNLNNMIRGKWLISAVLQHHPTERLQVHILLRWIVLCDIHAMMSWFSLLPEQQWSEPVHHGPSRLVERAVRARGDPSDEHNHLFTGNKRVAILEVVGTQKESHRRIWSRE